MSRIVLLFGCCQRDSLAVTYSRLPLSALPAVWAVPPPGPVLPVAAAYGPEQRAGTLELRQNRHVPCSSFLAGISQSHVLLPLQL